MSNRGLERPMQAGIDEAGRAPVLGPLVVAGVGVRDSALLAEMGCRDSKRLSPTKREAIARMLRSHPDVRIEVRSITPEVLDAERQARKINDIELDRFRDIALALHPQVLYVDAADPDAARFGRAVAEGLPRDIEVVSEHKADGTHLVVGAASIVAKVARDAAVAELARRLEPRLQMQLGSGYGGPRTDLFLRAWLAKFGDLPEGTRRSWVSARRLLSEDT
jgi:ribonuclease HII